MPPTVFPLILLTELALTLFGKLLTLPIKLVLFNFSFMIYSATSFGRFLKFAIWLPPHMQSNYSWPTSISKGIVFSIFSLMPSKLYSLRILSLLVKDSFLNLMSSNSFFSSLHRSASNSSSKDYTEFWYRVVFYLKYPSLSANYFLAS